MSSNAAFAKELDRLVREIAGDTKNAIVLVRARTVAEAELDLARVRRAKVAFIERASAFGEPDARSADGVRRVLPELRKLNRYERRAAARRDRAVTVGRTKMEV
jgi:hypothetical protein